MRKGISQRDETSECKSYLNKKFVQFCQFLKVTLKSISQLHFTFLTKFGAVKVQSKLMESKTPVPRTLGFKSRLCVKVDLNL